MSTQDPDLRYDVARRRAIARASRCGRTRRRRSPSSSSGSASTSSRPGSPAHRPATSRACAPSPPPCRRRPSRRSSARTATTSTPPPRRSRGAVARASTSCSRTSADPHGEEARARARRRSSSRRAGRSSTSASRVDEVEFSCEDATRSDPAFVARVCRAAIRAGATVDQPSRHRRLCAARASTPAFIAEVRRRCPRAARGRRSPCTATTISGSRSRTRSPGSRPARTQVECTINGIGERAGNASLEEIVMALRVRADALRRRDRHRHRRRSPRRRASSRELTGLRRPAEQGDRRRERVRARGGHPPGRDAEGRADVPDHGSGVESACA